MNTLSVIPMGSREDLEHALAILRQSEAMILGLADPGVRDRVAAYPRQAPAKILSAAADRNPGR